MENKINPNEISKELLAKAQACETPEELLTLAKENGYELTKEEAEAFLAEGGVADVPDEEMSKAAGGYKVKCNSYYIPCPNKVEYIP